MALFLTGRKHAGENLARVLSHRAGGRAAPIQICDALARNLPGKLETIVASWATAWPMRDATSWR